MNNARPGQYGLALGRFPVLQWHRPKSWKHTHEDSADLCQVDEAVSLGFPAVWLLNLGQVNVSIFR